MRKNVLLVTVVAALTILSGLALLSNKSTNTSKFSIASLANHSFKATFSGTIQDTSFNAVLKHDAQDNVQYTVSSNGDSTDIIVNSDGYFSCQNDVCYKYPSNSTISASFNPDDYTYTGDGVDRLEDLATYEGKQDCPAGICDVWATIENTFTTRLFISTADRRISKVVSSDGTDSTTIIYSYEDVTVTKPTNIQEVPSL